MKLSVLVPVYNLAAHIGDCLESLVRQKTSFPFEVVVGDDASTDGSRAIVDSYVARYPGRVRLLAAGPNLGLVGNLRRLMGTVGGEYVAYLDGDDLALPGKLEAQVNYLDEHPDCAIVYHESDMFDSATGIRLKNYSRGYYNWSHIPPRATLEHLVRYGTFMHAGSVMLRAHEKLVLSIEPRCRIIADYPMAIMNAGFLGGTIDFIDRRLARYRIHPGSFTSATQRSPERRLAVMEELITACSLGRRFGVSEEAVQAGTAHAVYAASLYFLRNREDELFQTLIDRSHAQGFLFDDRHETAVELRDQPEAARKRLFAV